MKILDELDDFIKQTRESKEIKRDKACLNDFFGKILPWNQRIIKRNSAVLLVNGKINQCFMV